MPTEALKQALRAVNVAGVEKNFAEVLAKMFDLPVAVVARVVYAIENVKHPVTWHLGEGNSVELIPDPEVRQAIRDQANAGAKRTYLRKLQLEGRQVKVRTLAMIPPDDPSKICEGCPKTIQCVAESLSTPERCISDMEPPLNGFYVNPIQIVTLLKVTSTGKVTVKARQPQGEHELSITEVEF